MHVYGERQSDTRRSSDRCGETQVHTGGQHSCKGRSTSGRSCEGRPTSEISRSSKQNATLPSLSSAKAPLHSRSTKWMRLQNDASIENQEGFWVPAIWPAEPVSPPPPADTRRLYFSFPHHRPPPQNLRKHLLQNRVCGRVCWFVGSAPRLLCPFGAPKKMGLRFDCTF